MGKRQRKIDSGAVITKLINPVLLSDTEVREFTSIISNYLKDKILDCADAHEDYIEVYDVIDDMDGFSSYNVLAKEKPPISVKFFKHEEAVGQEISILIDGVDEWEIFLSDRGTWRLK